MKKIKQTTKHRKSSDAVEILRRAAGHNPPLMREIALARVNARVAQMIYDRRTEAGLTQQQLADRVGTKQSVIARLENGEYDGHSLSMLQKIAAALHRHIEVTMPLIDQDVYGTTVR